MRFGLIGPSYESQSPNADCQKTVNLLLEAIESGSGKNTVALYPMPGTRGFCAVDNQTGTAVASVEVEHGEGTSAVLKSVRVQRNYPKRPASSGAEVAGGASWIHPEYIAGSDYTYCDLNNGTLATQGLEISGFGFTLPSDQEISTLYVDVDLMFSGTGINVEGWTLSLLAVKDGALLGAPTIVIPLHNSAYSQVYTGTFIDGGSGFHYTPAMLNSPTFGFRAYITAPSTSHPTTTIWLRSPHIEVNVAPYLTIETEEEHGFTVGSTIGFTQVTTATWLNEQTVTVDAVPSPTSFTAKFERVTDYYGLDSGVCWGNGIVSPYVIIKTEGANPFAVGTVVTFTGLTVGDFLNGHSVTLATADPEGFTAPFGHADFGPMDETSGKVILGAVTGFNPIRNLIGRKFSTTERCFTASGPNFFEVLSDKTYVLRGGIINDGSPISFAANPNELIVCSGGFLYRLDLATNDFDQLSDSNGVITDIAKVIYADGYVIAQIKNSKQFRISGIYDGSTWNPLDVAEVSLFADNIVSMLEDHGELVIFGETKSLVYQNTGNPDFPFEPNVSARIDQGCAALFSPERLDNAPFWLGKDERGHGIVWRGLSPPQRVSNHAIEYAIQQMTRIDDAIAYCYQMDGHSIYHILFPSGGRSFRYDVATGSWSDADYWNDGISEPHHSQCHAFVFGKHLVGDWSSGNVYEMSIDYHDDNGNPIHRLRRSPHISSENIWLKHKKVVIDCEVGLALTTGQGSDPLLMLRYSDDGGHTWSYEKSASLGKTGEYRKRIVFLNLGRARDRVYEISCSEPIPVRIIDGYVECEPCRN